MRFGRQLAEAANLGVNRYAAELEKHAANDPAAAGADESAGRAA